MTEQEPTGKHGKAAENRTRKKVTLSKVLPTDRLNFQKQLEILRAFAVSREANPTKPVTNIDVGAVVDMSPMTVVMSNAFFNDVGLLTRVEGGFVPSQEVMDFNKAFTWNPATAGTKLSPLVLKTWFCQALLPRLKFRALFEHEAVQVLAEVSNAGKEYETNIKILVEYMAFAGIVKNDKGTLLYQAQSSEELIKSVSDILVRDGHMKPLPQDPPPPPPKTDPDLDEYVLVLDADKKRKIVVQSPHSITSSELERIRSWLGFQLIISDQTPDK